MTITPEVIAQLKDKHPGVELEILRHPTLPDVAVARPATEGEWKMYQDEASDKAKQRGATRKIVNACVVYPSGDQLASAIKNHPGLVGAWFGEIAEMTGATLDMQREKL